MPSALPYFFSALKIAVPLSVIGAAIGEWLGAQAGLGYFSKRMMTQLDGAGVFAPIVLLSLLAILFVILISLVEKKFISWREAFMKFLKRIFVFTLLVAMIAGCSSNSASEKSKKEKEITVMLDWYPNAVHSFIYAAIEKRLL